MAHINPENFSLLESQKKPNQHCLMWFIGLEFVKTEHLNLDLTIDIKNFVETVNKQAMKINMYKEGMTLEAKSIRRRELTQYICKSVIKRERKASSYKVSSTNEKAKKRPADQNIHETENKKSKLSTDIQGVSVSK